MTYSDIIILIIIIALEEFASQKDYFDNFQEVFKADTRFDEFSPKLKEEEITKITNFIKSIRLSDRERSRINNPTSYCRSFETCHECVKSLSYVCGWCHNFGCTSQPNQLCPYTKRKSNGVNSCPYISHKGPILIPAEVRRHIKVELSTPDPALYNADVICQLKFKKRLTHLKALVLNEIVYCYPLTLTVEKHPDTETGTFSLIWGGAQPISNEIMITVYRCEALAIDCDGCRMLPPEYGCGWCDERNSCVIGEKCADHLMKWTVNRLKCDAKGKKLFYV